ncbi:hypothetical protein BS47DRAFT_1398620 [Hydnum rufescens UP504]|uniref:PXA domain-containing protein n=1 Tax=Hydnum rufescens UP504 TaxID=1448309 RepID=A0A9P6DQI8_9AGAM|nr:hypothetical protein BS47DRAFT_1398620 [Hydnum rufescens UP504]
MSTTSQAGPSVLRTSSGISQDARSHRSMKSATSGSSHIPTTIPLSRRLLHPHQPAGPLPPIFVGRSNAFINDLPRLNEEMYDFIALALRAYVSPWWSKLSARDKEFVPEISLVIVHALQTLEQRLVVADLPSLIFYDIPTLIVQHQKDYRAASAKVHTSYASDGASLPRLFHNSQTHLAISEDGEFNDTYLRQAVEHVLRSCLPKEDWESEMERSILREILVRPILGSVLPKLAQPWFLHTIALSLLGHPESSELPPPQPPPPPSPPSRMLLGDIVVTILTLIQTISTFCLHAIAFCQSLFSLISIVNALPPSEKRPRHRDLAIPLILVLGDALSMRDRATGSAILSILEIIAGFSRPFLDEFVHLSLRNGSYAPLLTPPRLTRIVVLSKKILFPDGYPGPPPIVPTPEEQESLRLALERRLTELIPPRARATAHLVILIFDAILLTLFPEMGVGGPPTSGAASGVGDGEDTVANQEEDRGLDTHVDDIDLYEGEVSN